MIPAAQTGLIPLFVAALLFCSGVGATDNAERTLGVNKFDLVLQHFGTASGGDGSPAYRKVTQAMARKSVLDAKNAGIRFFRISATGFAPSGFGLRGDLDLWRSDREAYWRVYDGMMDELAENGIRLIPSFVWNLRQFPAMARETVRDMMTRPESRSYRLLEDYVADFVTRYRRHPALLFYEIGNELNLSADLDAAGRCIASHGRQPCEAHGNFTTDEMIAFMQRVARHIRALDPSRPISSGHSFPRPSAQHLRRRPEFAPGGPDWTKDSAEELAAYLADTHRDFELMSVHIYEGEPLPRFLHSDAAGLVALSAHLARELGKTLFIGEVGGRSAQGIEPGSFLDRALAGIESEQVHYAALWVWQFYQTSTYRSFDHHNTQFNIEPGYSDALIRRLAKMNQAPVASDRRARDRSAPVVIITWPLHCARVDSVVTVHVAASADSDHPPRVELQQGGRRWPAGDRPPYRAEVGGLAPGEHALRAVAEDRMGNRASWETAVVAGAPPVAFDGCRLCCN